MKKYFFLVVIGLGLSACASQKGQMVIFENIQVRYDSEYNEAERTAFIINTEAELQAALTQLQLSPRRGTPDLAAFLSDRTLVFVYGGMRRTAGHRLHVTKVVQKRNTLIVRARMLQPGPNCVTSDVITYPLQVVAIPKNESVKLTLDFLESIQDCE